MDDVNVTARGKSPVYPWYPRDFNNDEPVQLMTLEEEGAYRRLLDHQWLHGSIPSEIPAIARICKNVSVAKLRKLWPKIRPCFVSVLGDQTRLYNRKLERIRTEREQFRQSLSESGKRGAARRWGAHREASGEASGVAIERPMAKAWLAMAMAKAIEGRQPQPPARARALLDGIEGEVTPLIYAQRCTGACNRGLTMNPAFANGSGFNELVTSSQGEYAKAWFEAGIPLEVAAGVILTRAIEYKPTPRFRQPAGLAYFDRAVRDAWERRQAGDQAADVQPERADSGSEDSDFVRAGRALDRRP